MSQPTLETKALQDAFRAAFIPSGYCVQNKTLDAVPHIGPALRAHITDGGFKAAAAAGGVVRILADGKTGTDAVYLYARGAVLCGAAVAVMPLPLLLRRASVKELSDSVVPAEATVLVVPGMTCELSSPAPEEVLYYLDWLFRAWVSNGGVLVWQGLLPLDQCSYWTRGLADFLDKHTLLGVSASQEKHIPGHGGGVRVATPVTVVKTPRPAKL